MDFFILRNTTTGWEGSVTEKIYNDRIRQAEYEDPRTKAVKPKATTPKATKPKEPVSAANQWEVISSTPGWFDVVKDGEKANEKSMRKQAAAKLRDELNES